MASEIKSKLKKNAAVITALLLMLGITTLALILSFGEVKENLWRSERESICYRNCRY